MSFYCHSRYPGPEVQGGKIALIVDKNNNFVQQPPHCLDRMHASLPKQVAYNQRILKAGAEIHGINCDLAKFLTDMNLTPEVPVIVCVDAGNCLRDMNNTLEANLGFKARGK
jgi:hypothetical protein